MIAHSFVNIQRFFIQISFQNSIPNTKITQRLLKRKQLFFSLSEAKLVTYKNRFVNYDSCYAEKGH